MTPDQLAAIKARCDGATPGPWQRGSNARDVNGFELSEEVHLIGDPEAMICDTHGTVGDTEKHRAVAQFIAHSRTDIPALLSHIESQDAIIEQLRERLERAKRSGG